MSQALSVVQSNPVMKTEVDINDLRIRAHKLATLMKEIMTPEVHFGKIPGCGDKPCLFKAGAEKIAACFMLGVKPVVEESTILVGTTQHIRYRVTAEIHHLVTGAFLGSGIGEASTAEEKFRWRAAFNQTEWNEFEPSKRRKRFTRNGTMHQVEAEPVDKLNTVLKMAKKRAMVDGILTVTGASDLFQQDIEELAADIEEFNRNHPAPVESQPVQATTNFAPPVETSPTTQEVSAPPAITTTLPATNGSGDDGSSKLTNGTLAKELVAHATKISKSKGRDAWNKMVEQACGSRKQIDAMTESEKNKLLDLVLVGEV